MKIDNPTVLSSETFSNTTNSNTVKLQSGVTSASYTLTLPTAVAAVTGYVLSSTDAGVLSWAAAGSGANTALSNLAAVAINTTLVSDTDNTDALGTAAISWSDLFLGDGAVITFSSAPSTADVTITHSANTLTLAGGDLIMDTSLGSTGTRVLKGWFTDLQVTNAIAGSITGNAGTASAIAVGGITGLGTGVATALAVNIGSAGAFIVNGGALGTPSSGTVTNLTGTASININGTVGATTPTTIVGTTITANTGLVPDVNDGAYIGISGTAFSDLFLASGGVIDWLAGASTITHSANTLTIGGSGATTLALGTNSITMTGSLAATGARVTKGWFTDLESTNMPTVGGSAILSSLTAPTFNTIELGTAQTDTTLARVSAGVVSIEGVNIMTVGATQTVTGQNKFNNLIDVNNAITASGNAATVPITYRLNTVTNNSAATLTITMTTTSAVDGQMTIVRILDASAAAQTITWVNTENSTVSAPTTSNGSTTLFLTVGFIYNGGTSKWRCIASA